MRESPQKLISLSELAALRYVRGQHTRRRLAEVFMDVLTELGVLQKVWLILLYVLSLF